jgi:hypothetical protein
VHIRYDNLKAAVSRVLFGRTRVENARWVTFRSHYGFDAFYCAPGLDGAHEKGGVEGEGGRFRRTHLVPMPQVASLDELNERLAAHDTADDARRIASRAQPVGQDFALEAPLLRPLPAERFETGVTLSARVDRHARITVRQCQYSVPARLIGQRVRVLLRATGLLVFDGRRQVAVRERATVRGTQTLVLDHYLEVLARKPGALPGATALAQARAAGSFSTAHEAWWAAARAAHGDAGGTRALVEVLLLHRHLPATAVTAGLQAALAIGATSPDVVAVEARRASPGQDTGTGPSGTGPSGTGPSGTGPVLTLPVRPGNPTVLTPDQRPLPTVTGYDELLSRRTPSRVDPTPPVTAGEAIS